MIYLYQYLILISLLYHIGFTLLFYHFIKQKILVKTKALKNKNIKT